MTLNEFKAWLEGFEESMGGEPPTAEQYKAIKAKLSRVLDAPSVRDNRGHFRGLVTGPSLCDGGFPMYPHST